MREPAVLRRLSTQPFSCANDTFCMQLPSADSLYYGHRQYPEFSNDLGFALTAPYHSILGPPCRNSNLAIPCVDGFSSLLKPWHKPRAFPCSCMYHGHKTRTMRVKLLSSAPSLRCSLVPLNLSSISSSVLFRDEKGRNPFSNTSSIGSFFQMYLTFNKTKISVVGPCPLGNFPLVHIHRFILMVCLS